MSGVLVSASTAEVACGIATAVTVLQVKAPTNQRLKIKEINVSFDGAPGGTDAPAVVQILRQTGAGTMTSLTPQKRNGAPETAQATAQHTATVEPAGTTVIMAFEAHVQFGLRHLFYPGTEIEVPGAGYIGIQVTSPAAVNCIAEIVWEE